MSIKTSRDQNQFGFEVGSGFPQGLSYCIHYFLRSGMRGEGEVSGIPLPCASAFLIGHSGSGIMGMLMGGNEVYGIILVKDILSTIPMMYIPVQNQDMPDLIFRLGITGGDGNIIQ